MKVMVTGVGGQLGFDVKSHLISNGHDTISPTHSELDITDFEKVREYMMSAKPEAVIHCAAWTNVDLAEDEIEKCREVNVKGTGNIAEMCKILNIPILYVSTDYVFDGTGNIPWEIDSETNPINEYGRSKLDGEKIIKELKKHFIVRISWVFGINGRNFIKTMINLSKTRDAIEVVNDQFGSPTYTADLAPLLCDMICTEKYGTYHAHNEGFCSWFDLAKKIFEITNTNITVNPIPSEKFVTKANRPKNSMMSTESLTTAGFEKLPMWTDAVERFVSTLNQ